jgi:hypothetical protein
MNPARMGPMLSMQPRQQWTQWNCIARRIREARRQCAGRSYRSAADFGLRFSDRLSKKALLESGRPLKRPCALSMSNISPVCARPRDRSTAVGHLEIQGSARPNLDWESRTESSDRDLHRNSNFAAGRWCSPAADLRFCRRDLSVNLARCSSFL